MAVSPVSPAPTILAAIREVLKGVMPMMRRMVWRPATTEAWGCRKAWRWSIGTGEVIVDAWHHVTHMTAAHVGLIALMIAMT